MQYPEMVKTSARYRGPMESRKMNGIVRDVYASLQLLREQIDGNTSRLRVVQENVMDEAIHVVPDNKKSVAISVARMKGGEF